jgi:hypothetical protein
MFGEFNPFILSLSKNMSGLVCPSEWFDPDKPGQAGSPRTVLTSISASKR